MSDAKFGLSNAASGYMVLHVVLASTLTLTSHLLLYFPTMNAYSLMSGSQPDNPSGETRHVAQWQTDQC